MLFYTRHIFVINISTCIRTLVRTINETLFVNALYCVGRWEAGKWAEELFHITDIVVSCLVMLSLYISLYNLRCIGVHVRTSSTKLK